MMLKLLMPLLLIILVSAGCSGSKNAAYFLNQGTAEISSSNQGPKQLIEINDLLSINISSLSSQTATAFNSTNTGGFASVSYGNAITPVSGYLVDPEGYIKFPQVGKIKVTEFRVEFCSRQRNIQYISHKVNDIWNRQKGRNN